MAEDITTIAKPKNLDLAVPPLGPSGSGVNLRQVAKGFSDWVTPSWRRAANVEYRAGMNGPPVSLIVEGGKVWSPGDPRWPVFLVLGDKAKIVPKADYDEVISAKFAFSAGPWLVRGNQVCNIANEIKVAGFSGLMEGSPRERAAIGVRADGMVVHYATMASTLPDLAAKMKNLGCVDAINLDGGGSVGVLVGDKLIVGYSSRQVCCALMFREIEEDVNPDAGPPEIVVPAQGGAKGMKICLDPGHGGPDPGAVGADRTPEKDVVLLTARLAKRYLERQGAEVVLTRHYDEDVSLAARAKAANEKRCDYFVSIHANAAESRDASGYEVFHYPGSSGGKSLAGKVSQGFGAATGLSLRRIADANFQVLRETTMPAVLVELGFMTNKGDLTLLKEPAFIDKAALGIAFGIMRT